MFRLAREEDIKRVGAIYDAVIDADTRTDSRVCWQKGVYPTEATAAAALERGDLFVCEEVGVINSAAIINRVQVPVYRDCPWEFAASDDEVMVLHTLVVDPAVSHRGLGRRFVAFYEQYARENGCTCLRMDTNAKNILARRLYESLGYREAAVLPCEFNGIAGVELVCLEKKL